MISLYICRPSIANAFALNFMIYHDLCSLTVGKVWKLKETKINCKMKMSVEIKRKTFITTKSITVCKNQTQKSKSIVKRMWKIGNFMNLCVF